MATKLSPNQEAISRIQEELNLSKYEATIKSHPNVWAQLVAAHRKASRDAKLIPDYRALLTRLVDTASKKEALGDAPLDAECQRLATHVTDTLTELERQSTRFPKEVAAWCQKHLPEEYADFESVFSSLMISSQATRSDFDTVHKAFDAMIDGYKNFNN